MAKNEYIGVSNVARKVKQPNIGVDGVARKVKSGFIGVDNVARQFFQGGTPISNFAVGTSVYLNENGTAQEYIVVNQGIPSGSSLYDSSCNGTWLLRKYPIESMAWTDYYNGSNIYENSVVHSWLNSTMLSKFDSGVQSIIKQVKIPYRQNGGSGTDQSGANGLSCKLFLLSVRETGYIYKADASGGVPVDGAKLDYFETGNGPAEIRVAYFNGKAVMWWLRSPFTFNSGSAFKVNDDGTSTTALSTNSNYVYVRPALVMSFETLIDENMNIIA